IHPGAFVSGSGALHDPTEMATRDGVVVVTINYRLGVFGFMAHPALDTSPLGSGNFGVEDQQAALQWVRHNARAFGGDAHNVTISAESTGGISVPPQLASPPGHGLSDRATSQSGPCTPFQDVPTAESTGAQLAAAVGCASPDGAAGCLRSRPVADLLNAMNA